MAPTSPPTGVLAGLHNITVEKSLLIIDCTSVAGEGHIIPRESADDYLCKDTESMLIAHKILPDRHSFTVNKRAVLSDVVGIERPGSGRDDRHMLDGSSLPDEFSSGGQSRTFPPEALRFLLER